ncbi:type I-B CRISPR-associated protein Cas7/Cst2/DevR [Enterococcus entomosocium]|uniref:Type I-B CRISPR-associated protein Cas7/Cst2/DevR n=1 Tax=Enterococcus entomosocium TaxID=3034352 RepID=A0ABV3MEL1_9ENTE|nr:type I-B CRISPR-associated protein Cas7/Cst2/DevR [Enterococcus casseliflavus]MDB1709324.1 type I-B CRISPR-associated protein Cas7/Cst2/DevR [Enterococcus casseliflavus]MDB1716881.1 type I-B CRISPR-associated protein Cas7/Cst2/DevR [Enterococcus casseliflavus]
MSKGLTITMIFLAESANYGESLGNVATLKKITRGKGEQYTYISRQALRYNIIEQLGEPLASLSAEGSGTKQVIQFDQKATIDRFPEVDLFGYMKTAKGDNALTRSAKVRLSNAISLETYKGDTDFLTNMGLAKRLRENGNEKAMNSIAQSEIHRSFYRYTVTVDLDEIGIDRNSDIALPKEERSRRVQKLLETIQYLYRDIRGRRENLQPLFVVGGVYDRKNPLFENVVDVKQNRVDVEKIEGVLTDELRQQTLVGVVKDAFENTAEIQAVLQGQKIPQVFESLQQKVAEYYEGD